MKLTLLAISISNILSLIAGFFLGSIWINKGQDEMMRQMAQVVMIARGM